MAGMVTQVRLDYAFTLVVEPERFIPPDGVVVLELGRAVAFELRIQESFVLGRCGEEFTFDPEGEPMAIAPALALSRQDIEQAVAFKDGSLRAIFSDGGVLRVPGGEKYEPWQIVGPAGFMLVSLPGGDLAVWSPGGRLAGRRHRPGSP